MAERGLSGWQIISLVMGVTAILALAAVALILGKDAIIALAIVFVIGLVFAAWLNS